MKKIVVSILFILPLLNMLTGCSHKAFPTGRYQAAVVTVDGNLSEWSDPLHFISTGGLALYDVTNDDNNIYICVETHDELTALKILRAGINIYIDPAGGKNKNTCLSFPLPNTNTPGKRGNNGAGAGSNEFRQGLLAQAISFTTVGFKNLEDRTYDISDKKGIKVALSSLPFNGLGYEAAIPIQYIFGTMPATNNANRNLTVGITINAMKGEGQNHGVAGGSSGAGAGMRGGGRGAGGRGMGGGGNYHRNGATENNESAPGAQTPDRTALYKADINWYTFKLAGKQ